MDWMCRVREGEEIKVTHRFIFLTWATAQIMMLLMVCKRLVG